MAVSSLLSTSRASGRVLLELTVSSLATDLVRDLCYSKFLMLCYLSTLVNTLCQFPSQTRIRPTSQRAIQRKGKTPLGCRKRVTRKDTHDNTSLTLSLPAPQPLMIQQDTDTRRQKMNGDEWGDGTLYGAMVWPGKHSAGVCLGCLLAVEGGIVSEMFEHV